MTDAGTTTIDRTNIRPADGPQFLPGLELITGIVGPPVAHPQDWMAVFTTMIHTSVRHDLVLARYVDEAGQREIASDRLALLASQDHLSDHDAQVVNSVIAGDTDAAGLFDAGLPVVDPAGGLALARVLTTIATRPRPAPTVDFSAAGTFTVVMAGIGGAVVGGACFGPAGAAIGAETAASVAASVVQ